MLNSQNFFKRQIVKQIKYQTPNHPISPFFKAQHRQKLLDGMSRDSFDLKCIENGTLDIPG
jgi:hypothetical protein